MSRHSIPPKNSSTMSFFEGSNFGQGPPTKRGRLDDFCGPTEDFRALGQIRQTRPMSTEDIEFELNSRKDGELGPRKVLLITVFNPTIPINVEILNKVCSKVIDGVGKVAKIVVFQRGSAGMVQGMVEFDGVEAAVEARKKLHGNDIYTGSCTLKVEFARTEELIIKRNNELSWDLTKVQQAEVRRPPRKGILDDELEGVPVTGVMCGDRGGMGGFDGQRGMDRSRGFINEQMGGMSGQGGFYGGQRGFMGKISGQRGGMDRYMGGMMDREGPSGLHGCPNGTSCVLMIYSKIPDKLNCDKLFNLFCLYGNVNRIMFLKKIPGCAMLEMGNPEQANEAVKHLQTVKIFGDTLQVQMSRGARTIDRVSTTFDLLDGTESTKDYYESKNNRFRDPERAVKNRRIAPTKCLHFYNVPYPQPDDSVLEEVITDQGAPGPVRIKWLEPKSERACLGLMEFESVEAASEAVLLCNHALVNADNLEYPYQMKLSFSPAIIR